MLAGHVIPCNHSLRRKAETGTLRANWLWKLAILGALGLIERLYLNELAGAELEDDCHHHHLSSMYTPTHLRPLTHMQTHEHKTYDNGEEIKRRREVWSAWKIHPREQGTFWISQPGRPEWL